MIVSLLGITALVWFGAVGSLPLAGPPRALDPALSAVAPEVCMWYSSSAGTTAPDSDSANNSEKLLAEPEVQHFLTTMEEQLLLVLRRRAGTGHDERVVCSEVPKLIKALLTLPFAIYVEDVELTGEGVRVRAGMVLRAGDQRATVEGAISSLLALKGDSGPPINTVDQDRENWSTVRIAPGVPELRWGWRDDYFLLAVGEGSAETMLERMQGSAPAWLTQRRREHRVDNESWLGYLNVELVLDRLRPVLEQKRAWQHVKKLGLNSIQAVHGIAGFDSEGRVAKSHLVTDGQRRGLLLPYKPLSKRDLRTIPREAMVGFAVRTDIDELWDDVVRLIGDYEPRAVERVERALWEAETELGVHLKDDLLSALGDVWIAYLPAGDLMTSWLGSAAAVRVKDAEQLRTSIDKLVAVVQSKVPQGRRRGIRLRETVHQGHSIRFINVVGESFPLAPAWCVTDDWLVFGLMPQTVRTVISQEVEASLADVAPVRELVSASDAPAVVSYFDTPRLVRSLYPLLQIGGQLLSAELQSEGIDVDVSVLLALETIVKHVRPGMGTITHRSDGFHFDSRHSLPGGGNVVAVAPLMVAGLLPAVKAARQAAERSQEINKLKQIALAFHNYESAHGHLPTNVYDENGEALLSWRVQLLPYLEGHQFPEKFHMDESWDSPHNRKLAQNMPEVFATARGQEPAAAGETRYVALAGDETLFPGRKRLGFADVRDGTSNTLMFVTAAPSAAVPWTKPVDIQFDSERPLRGIKSTEKRFVVALCDGSCHWFKMLIDEETIRALATRAGSEVVDISKDRYGW